MLCIICLLSHCSLHSFHITMALWWFYMMVLYDGFIWWHNALSLEWSIHKACLEASQIMSFHQTLLLIVNIAWPSGETSLVAETASLRSSSSQCGDSRPATYALDIYKMSRRSQLALDIYKCHGWSQLFCVCLALHQCNGWDSNLEK